MFKLVASEIVCAVDSNTPTSELDHLKGIADSIYVVEKSPYSVDSYLAWLHSRCGGDWIFKIDSDEVPSQRLLDELPLLIHSHDAQVMVTRRWCVNSSSLWLMERPWYPDWQDRLLRNDGTSLRFYGLPHTNSQPRLPMRYVDAPIYHLDCILSDFATRELKVKRYDELIPGAVSDDGRPLNSTIYLPEITASRKPELVPEEDEQLILLALEGKTHPDFVRDRNTPSEPIFVPWIEIEKYWAQRQFAPAAYMCEVELHDPNAVFRGGQPAKIVLSIRNMGDEIWPFGQWYPAIRIGCVWFTRDNIAIETNNISTMFTCDVHPGETVLQEVTTLAPVAGEYNLVLGIYHEGVRWFEKPLNVLVIVR